MTTEALPVGAHDSRPGSIFEYPACGGQPGSSKDNWVPVDYLGYLISKALHITDEDLKKRKSGK